MVRVSTSMPNPTARDALPRSDEFRAWLTTLELEGRSLSDVVSRTRRAWGMIDLQATLTDADVNYRLSSSGAFLTCTHSVQSQLRRAARLYCRFSVRGHR